MESNCKSICKKDGGINLYDEACCKCATEVLGNLASIVSEFASWVTVTKVLITWTNSKLLEIT